MIRNDISTFLDTKNPRWYSHIVLIMLSDLLKKHENMRYLVVEPKMYFLAKLMESSTYLDHQYFIILNLST